MSLAEYTETGNWNNLNESVVLNTGEIYSIKYLNTLRTGGVLESITILAGRFNYLNSTNSITNFGNIAILDANDNFIQLGQGCNGPITAVTVTNSPAINCTSNFCSTIIAVGKFDKCYLASYFYNFSHIFIFTI